VDAEEIRKSISEKSETGINLTCRNQARPQNQSYLQELQKNNLQIGSSSKGLAARQGPQEQQQ
jgi:hypothetical protein